ncbi:MAG: hypothetical protein RIC80_11925 [Cyclobacteriaceae bacterium]
MTKKRSIKLGLWSTGLLMLFMMQAKAQIVQTGYATSNVTGNYVVGQFDNTVIAGEYGSGQVVTSDAFYSATGFLAGQVVTFSFGLRRDSVVLATIYQQMGGTNWVSGTDTWLTNPNVGQWFGVELNNNLRVNKLLLPSNGLTGNLPATIAELTKLDTLDIRDNAIRSLPKLSNLPEIDHVDAAENKLGFASIIRNLDLPSFEYDPQKAIGDVLQDTIQKGEDYRLEVDISGQDNSCQWSYKGVELEGATNKAYVIPAINFDNMGEYSVVATNPGVPGLTLTSETQTVLASASITGIAEIDAGLLPAGEATLYQIQEGPFDSVFTSTVAAGDYELTKIVLGDYILRVRDVAVGQYLQTYFSSAETWSLGDTIRLRDNLENVDTRMINVPAPIVPDPANTNVVTGILEIDTDNFPGLFDDPAGGRQNARRRVKRAGCAFNRARFVDRGEDEDFELIAYRETDENGEFSFEDLPDGLYRINFDFPGIPTDPNSFVEFELGANGQLTNNTIRLAAEVEPQGIVVTKVEETGILNPLIGEFTVYPVPYDQELTVRFDLRRYASRSVSIEMVNMDGKLLLQQSTQAVRGLNEVTIVDPPQVGGVYIILLKDASGEVLAVSRVVK